MLLRASSSGATVSRREAALVLSEQGVARVASTLMMLLTETPGDERVGFELAVLTCQDFRAEGDPALAWWSWWDTVPHDDALGWLLRAAEERGLAPPPREALTGPGTRAGARFLLQVGRSEEGFLVERARRELARAAAQAPHASPPAERLLASPSAGRARAGWLLELEAWIERRWPE